MTPHDVTGGSGRRVWWKCDEGPDHEWQTKVEKRAILGHRCPFCANQRVSITNCLATLYPRLAREFHKTKNGDLTPKTVHGRSKRAVW